MSDDTRSTDCANCGHTPECHDRLWRGVPCPCGCEHYSNARPGAVPVGPTKEGKQ